MAALGGVFGIAFGKMVFGGLGQNVFNPGAAGSRLPAGRFPGGDHHLAGGGAGRSGPLRGDNFALPFMHAATDAVTAATPLGLMKFEAKSTSIIDLLMGNTGGSLGETAAIAVLLGGPIWRCAAISTGALR